MKTSTFRIIISAGIGLGLLFFGVFIYILHQSTKGMQTSLAFHQEATSQAFDVSVTDSGQHPTEFEHQKISLEEE